MQKKKKKKTFADRGTVVPQIIPNILGHFFVTLQSLMSVSVSSS